MRESNELHANRTAASLPIHYLSNDSRAVIAAVHELNEEAGRAVAAYSFDAGPNPFVFAEDDDVEIVERGLLQVEGVTAEAVRTGCPCGGLACRLTR